MLKKIRGVRSGLDGEDFDNSYVEFVDEDDRDYNNNLSNEMNVDKMGGSGWLVEGGSLEDPSYYAKSSHLGNPYDASGNRETSNLIKQYEEEAEMADHDGEPLYFGTGEESYSDY